MLLRAWCRGVGKSLRRRRRLFSTSADNDGDSLLSPVMSRASLGGGVHMKREMDTLFARLKSATEQQQQQRADTKKAVDARQSKPNVDSDSSSKRPWGAGVVSGSRKTSSGSLKNVRQMYRVLQLANQSLDRAPVYRAYELWKELPPSVMMDDQVLLSFFFLFSRHGVVPMMLKFWDLRARKGRGATDLDATPHSASADALQHIPTDCLRYLINGLGRGIGPSERSDWHPFGIRPQHRHHHTNSKHAKHKQPGNRKKHEGNNNNCQSNHKERNDRHHGDSTDNVPITRAEVIDVLGMYEKVLFGQHAGMLANQLSLSDAVAADLIRQLMHVYVYINEPHRAMQLFLNLHSPRDHPGQTPISFALADSVGSGGLMSQALLIYHCAGNNLRASSMWSQWREFCPVIANSGNTSRSSKSVDRFRDYDLMTALMWLYRWEHQHIAPPHHNTGDYVYVAPHSSGNTYLLGGPAGSLHTPPGALHHCPWVPVNDQVPPVQLSASQAQATAFLNSSVQQSAYCLYVAGRKLVKWRDFVRFRREMHELLESTGSAEVMNVRESKQPTNETEGNSETSGTVDHDPVCWDMLLQDLTNAGANVYANSYMPYRQAGPDISITALTDSNMVETGADALTTPLQSRHHDPFVLKGRTGGGAGLMFMRRFGTDAFNDLARLCKVSRLQDVGATIFEDYTGGTELCSEDEKQWNFTHLEEAATTLRSISALCAGMNRTGGVRFHPERWFKWNVQAFGLLAGQSKYSKRGLGLDGAMLMRYVHLLNHELPRDSALHTRYCTELGQFLLNYLRFLTIFREAEGTDDDSLTQEDIILQHLDVMAACLDALGGVEKWVSSTQFDRLLNSLLVRTTAATDLAFHLYQFAQHHKIRLGDHVVRNLKLQVTRSQVSSIALQGSSMHDWPPADHHEWLSGLMGDDGGEVAATLRGSGVDHDDERLVSDEIDAGDGLEHKGIGEIALPKSSSNGGKRGMHQQFNHLLRTAACASNLSGVSDLFHFYNAARKAHGQRRKQQAALSALPPIERRATRERLQDTSLAAKYPVSVQASTWRELFGMCVGAGRVWSVDPVSGGSDVMPETLPPLAVTLRALWAILNAHQPQLLASPAVVYSYIHSCVLCGDMEYAAHMCNAAARKFGMGAVPVDAVLAVGDAVVEAAEDAARYNQIVQEDLYDSKQWDQARKDINEYTAGPQWNEVLAMISPKQLKKLKVLLNDIRTDEFYVSVGARGDVVRPAIDPLQSVVHVRQNTSLSEVDVNRWSSFWRTLLYVIYERTYSDKLPNALSKDDVAQENWKAVSEKLRHLGGFSNIRPPRSL